MTSRSLVPDAMERRRKARDFALSRDLDHLTKLAARLARKAGRSGITVENLSVAAANAGLLLAYQDRGYRARVFGSVMRAAGLERVPGVYVRTTRVGSKAGNVVGLWRAPR